MTPEFLQTTRLFHWKPSDYIRTTYPNGQPFSRLTLTLSAKGWSASAQWEGSVGSRGEGKTIEEAIQKAAEHVTNWACYLNTNINHTY
jgi:hypothetical protein